MSDAMAEVTMADLEKLWASALFGEEDVAALRASREVLDDQVEDVLDVWYGFIGSQPQLVATFVDQGSGQPDTRYLGAVRTRFGQWVRDTAAAVFDEAWLAQQLEIGRRHHRIGKNLTDGVNGSAIVPFRYLFPVLFPITHTLKPFLAKGGHPPEQVDAMAAAWLKVLLVQVTLWSAPYVPAEDF